ncbi:superfamily I DNA/RNA helicase/RecB family exonuclease [Neomicrococcus aestuarii]|uniref:DNA 3'-5' helicase n=1 Tax=Neomicrococcus aestuarii TaxID=556325 RepID=A0A7W8TVK1_9MICC|nr:ATP-dependent DNA helicase [Neomicrococcus aestuarii]MBB5513699.1 superfamily I DNA/RNA helicase/RecB family exonuclease [Neomicrococcus aestuarii]
MQEDTAHRLVLGAPGSGKTTTLLGLASSSLSAGMDPSRLLILTPSRLSAGSIRDLLSAQGSAQFAETPVRSWQSYSFDVIRRERNYFDENAFGSRERLLTGAEQDRLIGHILEGHARGIGRDPKWPADLAEAVQTRGFRAELREVFDRLSERGLAPEALGDMGRAVGRPDWISTASVYREYLELLGISNENAYDPAELISAAAFILDGRPEFLADERAGLDLIMVDDAQEMTPSQWELLNVLAGSDPAPRVVMFASPESAVQGFRGARPDMLSRFDEIFGGSVRGAETSELEGSFRLPRSIAAAWERMAQSIPVAVGGRGRQALREGQEDGIAKVALVDTPLHEERMVANRLLEAFVDEGLPWDRMVVIARHGQRLRTLSRHLSIQGIPVAVPPSEIPLKDAPAVRPLLDLMMLAPTPLLTLGDEDGVMDVVRRQGLEDRVALIESLLASRYGEATVMDVRRIRRGLLNRERAGNGLRGSTELLAAYFEEQVFGEPGDEEMWKLAGNRSRGILRVLSMARAGLAEQAKPGATPQTVLWAIWEAARLADEWQERVLAGEKQGVSAEDIDRANADLDAVMSLTQAAERFSSQNPGASARQFAEFLLDQDVPMDTLARPSHIAPGVEVLTPANAAGREWDLVIVVGLQEGMWPNTRLRGALLGADAIADVADYGTEILGQRTYSTLLNAVRADELRLFAVACSRARKELLCIGVSSEESAPSSFLDFVDPWTDPESARPITPVKRPRTLPGMVGYLRRTAEEALEADPSGTDPRSVSLVHDLGLVLSLLASAAPPVRGADPNEWWGLLELSSDQPVTPLDEPVGVSPSKVEMALKSPLAWFVSASGGEEIREIAASALGSLVHAIAEEYPDAPRDVLLEALEQRWHTLGLDDSWISHSLRVRAEHIIDLLAQYFSKSIREKRTVEHRELRFEARLEAEHRSRTAIVSGSIDRLEVGEDGLPLVVDLKTGGSAIANGDAVENPQMATYQAAIVEGAIPSVGQQTAGAKLVYVGVTGVSPSERDQPGIDPGDNWAKDLVLKAAELMGDSQFESIHPKGENGNCRVGLMCPLCASGRQVTQP